MDLETPIAEFQLMYSHPGKEMFYIGLLFSDNRQKLEPPPLFYSHFPLGFDTRGPPPGCSNQSNRSHFCEFVIRNLAQFSPVVTSFVRFPTIATFYNFFSVSRKLLF